MPKHQSIKSGQLRNPVSEGPNGPDKRGRQDQMPSEGYMFGRRDKGFTDGATYKFGKHGSKAMHPGTGKKQKRRHGAMTGHGSGGNKFGKPPGSTGSFGNPKFSGGQTKGFGGQKKR